MMEFQITLKNDITISLRVQNILMSTKKVVEIISDSVSLHV